MVRFDIRSAVTVIAALGLFSDSCPAQSRLRFPTLLQVNQPPAGTTMPGAAGATNVYPPAGTPPAPSPGYGSGTGSVYGGAPAPATSPGYGAPSSPPASSGGWTAPGGSPPPLLSPGASSPLTPVAPPAGYGPSSAPNYGGTPALPPGPTANFNGGILPPPGWDPYATPGTQPAPSLLPYDPYLQSPNWQMPSLAPVTTMRKFIQEVRGDYTWMAPGSGADKFGVQDLSLSTTFAFPFFYSTAHPLLVTPGFAFHWFQGPVSTPLPPQMYDAYLDAEWNPQFTEWFGAELGARVGVYSDFKKVTNDSIRVPAHGLIALRFSPSVSIKGGVVYLDRVHYKLIPAGGIEWRPNADNRFEIMFPNPKIAHRLGNDGATEWWVYVRGEYGGGSWTADPLGRFDYNDIRVALGLEFFRQKGLTGLIEVGGAFDREIDFANPLAATIYPKNTVFLRGGLAF